MESISVDASRVVRDITRRPIGLNLNYLTDAESWGPDSFGLHGRHIPRERPRIQARLR